MFLDLRCLIHKERTLPKRLVHTLTDETLLKALTNITIESIPEMPSISGMEITNIIIIGLDDPLDYELTQVDSYLFDRISRALTFCDSIENSDNKQDPLRLCSSCDEAEWQLNKFFKKNKSLISKFIVLTCKNLISEDCYDKIYKPHKLSKDVDIDPDTWTFQATLAICRMIKYLQKGNINATKKTSSFFRINFNDEIIKKRNMSKKLKNYENLRINYHMFFLSISPNNNTSVKDFILKWLRSMCSQNANKGLCNSPNKTKHQHLNFNTSCKNMERLPKEDNTSALLHAILDYAIPLRIASKPSPELLKKMSEKLNKQQSSKRHSAKT